MTSVSVARMVCNVSARRCGFVTTVDDAELQRAARGGRWSGADRRLDRDDPRAVVAGHFTGLDEGPIRGGLVVERTDVYRQSAAAIAQRHVDAEGGEPGVAQFLQ